MGLLSNVPLSLILYPLLFWVLYGLRHIRSKTTSYHYPPGPKGHWLFGNAPQLPKTNMGHKFAEWGRDYGDMFSIFMGQRRWVVLNSFAATKELLDQRGRLYISRPYFPVTQDILSGGNRIVIMQHGERWRKLRRIMHQLLTAKHADTYKPYQDIESRKLLWDYLQKPNNFYIHGARFSNSVIMSVVFGRRTSMSEDMVKSLFHSIDEFMALQHSPSASFIDGFPIIAKSLPRFLQWYRPEAERIFNDTVRTYRRFFDDLEKRIGAGEDPKCFSRELLNLAQDYGFDEPQKYFCAGTLIEAGSDTTRNQINNVIAAAAKFPEWVKKAQAELDSVCGFTAERLPSFDDYESLPYIMAVIKEGLRWRPNMIPTGMPRMLVEDDSWGPYRFEKGTIFTWNAWGISHNEKEFKDNERFVPERFMDENVYDVLKGQFGFGMGRRVCVGWQVGMRNMFIAFSRLLYCFDFVEVPGAPIDDARIDPLAHSEAPFQIAITPRSDAHTELIRRECQAAGESIN
ncbi:cytochrome P450 [Dactylonectria estremocensis]|uniref:Cytochrome P450 n=1 Tax=Dactylonectria estremocensis TaxID=1079267 RepID=A0A9P9EG49_9HYPO|nr:cytochrome P450 [Dactylonectria estremocensis]